MISTLILTGARSLREGAKGSGSAREFVKGLDRKQRFDMNKNGLEIKAVCVGTEKESSTAAGNTKTAVA
jgi:hypothetical protein